MGIIELGFNRATHLNDGELEQAKGLARLLSFLRNFFFGVGITAIILGLVGFIDFNSIIFKGIILFFVFFEIVWFFKKVK